jgi:acetyl esterase
MSGRSVPVSTAISAALGQLRCDEDMSVLLKTYDELGPPVPGKHTDPAAARRRPAFGDAIRLLRERRAMLKDDPISRVSARDITVQGAAGPLHARVYAPATAANGPLPVVLYFHGGGWVLGSIDADDVSARGIATRAQAIVVSVGYRLAPEHRFPAAWDDALAAYRWLLDNAPALRGDASRIALAGEGAGGTLALATALAARDRALPMPAHVLAVSPVAQTGTNTSSYMENAVMRPLSRAMMVWFFDRLVLRREDLRDPRLQLIDADFTGMPPVTLISARLDPLRSDAQRLHEALGKARVPVAWQEYAGVTHGFFGAAASVEKARLAQEYAGNRLVEALAVPAKEPQRSGQLRNLAAAFAQILPKISLAATVPVPSGPAHGQQRG